MAVAIAPWSIVLTPGEPEVVVPQGDLQIKNAALPDELQDDTARTSVKLTYLSLASSDEDEDDEDEDKDKEDEDDEEPKGTAVTTVLCSLTPGKIEQSTCEIILEQDMQYIFEAVGKNTIHLYGNYIDQAPVDQPPFGSDVDSEEDEEDAYGLNEVSSDVEIPVNVHEAALEDEDDIAERFEEVHEEEKSSPKPAVGLKRPREDDIDVDEHEEKLSKSQRKKLAKKLKAADGKPVPPPELEKKAEEKSEKKEKGEKKEKKDKAEKKDGDKKGKDGKDGEKKEKRDKKERRTLEGGVTVWDAKVGSGKMAKKGDKLEMRYIGKFPDGKVFDQNTKGKPFTFTLGQGDVIKGWDIGVAGMQIGGEREVIVPPSLGYGNKKIDGIPPNSTLKFEMKLLAIK